MKMRCWRRRTVRSTRSQLIRSQSRSDRAPFASVSCLTVNTPFAHVPISCKPLHFFGNGGIRLCLPTAGNFPRIPSVTPGLGLVHYPRRPRCCRWTLRLPSSRLAPRSEDRARGHLSQFRDDHRHERRRSARKTGGVVGHHGRPYEEAPSPAGQLPPPRRQRCGATIDDPMPFAFANPLPFPIGRRTSRCCSAVVETWASHVAAGHVLDTPVTRGRTLGFWDKAGVIISAS